MNVNRHRATAAVLLLALALAGPAGAASQARQAPPPEYKQIVAAHNISDAAARLKEFERLKLAYPNTPYMDAIATSIVIAKVEMAETLDAVIGLQKDLLAKGTGPARLQNPVVMAIQLLKHPKLASFEKGRVLGAILSYKDEAIAASADPASFEEIPGDQRDFLKTQVLSAMELATARAYLNAGDTVRAMASLEAYKKAGGQTAANYLYMLAAVKESTGKTAEAYDAYLAAAVDDFEDSVARAKAIYVKVNGRTDGFEAALAARAKALPFHPEPFKAPADWRGKAVLAELFTGSECPPCVGADLAFDGLVETFPTKYLAVLVYHLPIPRPDPMMNPATEAREAYYGVSSTPTVIIDGARDFSGGGNRGMAEGKFAQYRASVEPLLSALPPVMPAVRASLAGDKVAVTFDPDRVVPGAVYNLVLVQEEQEHKGGNGITYHKMVVRDLLAVDPNGPRSVTFDLAASEKAADEYLTAFEKSYARIPNFRWAVRRHVLPRRGLKVVFFVQDKESQKVLNAAVADVK